MSSSYNFVAATFNTKFKTKNSVQAAAQEFQNKHGSHGQGGLGKHPYRFGNFAVDDLTGDDARAKWLIDTGERNWDPSFTALENAIRNNLSQGGPQATMEFSIQNDGGQKARAEIIETKDAGGVVIHYKVILHCRT